MEALSRYLVQDEMKEHVLKCFARGFVSHFEYHIPEPWGSVNNYTPLSDVKGMAILRKRMSLEVIAGRMIGGPG